MRSSAARCVTAAVAAVPVLLAGCGQQSPAKTADPQTQAPEPANTPEAPELIQRTTTGAAESVPERPVPQSGSLRTFKVLQWNPHWECFASSGGCGSNAEGSLSSILTDRSIDFANVIEINERADDYLPPSPFAIATARCGSPVIDSTALIHDTSKWASISAPIAGCMENGDDRPFIVQTFRSLASSEKVIVVGAHFPHDNSGNGILKSAVGRALNAHPDALGVIFAADTNRERSISTESILRRVVPSSALTNNLAISELFPSCCHDNDGYPPRPYTHYYDRVAATFASSVTTQMLFDNPEPWWADVPNGEFHKALVATFYVDSGEGAQAVVA